MFKTINSTEILQDNSSIVIIRSKEIYEDIITLFDFDEVEILDFENIRQIKRFIEKFIHDMKYRYLYLTYKNSLIFVKRNERISIYTEGVIIDEIDKNLEKFTDDLRDYIINNKIAENSDILKYKDYFDKATDLFCLFNIWS